MGTPEHIKMHGFVGHFPVTVDEKGRIKLPVHFHNVLLEIYGEQSDHLYTCFSMDRNINIFPVPEWANHIEELQSGSVYDVQKRNVYTVVHGSTTVVELDKQARLKISPLLLKNAGIEKNAVICGFTTRMELWDAEKWDGFCSNALDNFLSTQQALYEEQKQLQLQKPLG